MEILKVREDGFIRIPKDVLKKLNILAGSDVAFIEKEDEIRFVKADKEMIDAETKRVVEDLKAAYEEKFATEHNTDEHGVSDEDREIVRLVKEVRAELWEELYAHND